MELKNIANFDVNERQRQGNTVDSSFERISSISEAVYYGSVLWYTHLRLDT